MISFTASIQSFLEKCFISKKIINMYEEKYPLGKMFKGRIHPNIGSIQNIFFGRLYSSDMILLYRAITGRYVEYPSLFVMTAGLGVFHDVTQTLGLVGAPTTTALVVGDLAEIFYNEAVENTVFKVDISELRDGDLWTGWDKFTELLRKDIEKVALPPVKLPPLKFEVCKFTLSPAGIELLPETLKFVYYIYRGDAEWIEYSFETASQYAPETTPLLSSFFPDLQRIMEYYREWVRARILGEEASDEAKIMSKVIFLSNYRWYALVGDLLSSVDEAFNKTGFQRGLMKIADTLRVEAERIRVVPRLIPF